MRVADLSKREYSFLPPGSSSFREEPSVLRKSSVSARELRLQEADLGPLEPVYSPKNVPGPNNSSTGSGDIRSSAGGKSKKSSVSAEGAGTGSPHPATREMQGSRAARMRV